MSIRNETAPSRRESKRMERSVESESDSTVTEGDSTVTFSHCRMAKLKCSEKGNDDKD